MGKTARQRGPSVSPVQIKKGGTPKRAARLPGSYVAAGIKDVRGGEKKKKEGEEAAAREKG